MKTKDLADARVKKAGLLAMKKLDEASAALRAFYTTARDAGYPVKGQDDSRLLLIESMQEYARYLSGRYDK
jgi:hypothetical protein